MHDDAREDGAAEKVSPGLEIPRAVVYDPSKDQRTITVAQRAIYCEKYADLMVQIQNLWGEIERRSGRTSLRGGVWQVVVDPRTGRRTRRFVRNDPGEMRIRSDPEMRTLLERLTVVKAHLAAAVKPEEVLPVVELTPEERELMEDLCRAPSLLPFNVTPEEALAFAIGLERLAAETPYSELNNVRETYLEAAKEARARAALPKRTSGDPETEDW